MISPYDNRIANAWNALPDAVVSASSVNSFKAKLMLFVLLFKFFISV